MIKRLISGVSLVALMCVSAVAFGQSQEDVLVNITSEMSRADLHNVRTQLLENGIDFRYENIKWNDQGKLYSIDLFIETEDGYKKELKTAQLMVGQKIQIMKTTAQDGHNDYCVGFNCSGE